MTGQTYTAMVPSSIALPSDPDDQSPDYDVPVEFTWSPGTPPGARTMANPMGTDDGAPDEFNVVTSGGIAEVDLPGNVVEAIDDWLWENWPRPEGHDYHDDHTDGSSFLLDQGGEA